MFKRANKITALLVAASSVMSLVPAMAADYKKIDSQDGTIYSAFAYKDGKAYIDGAIDDKDDATYYVADGKYTALEDIDSGDSVTKFKNYIDDNGDYSVNLEDGTVNDNNIVEDTKDDVASALRKKIKSDTEDRYNTSSASYTVNGTAYAGSSSDQRDYDALVDISNGSWYYTAYAAATKAIANKDNGSATYFNVFTDKDGTYIDADYNLGKVKVATTNGSATIENTNDAYDLSSSEKEAVRASVAQNAVLGQDDNYLYRLVTVTVSIDSTIAPTDGITKINGKAITDTGVFTDVHGDQKTVSYKAIQKISKAADSSDVDGANVAKTVSTYAVSTDKAAALSSTVTGIINGATKYAVNNGKITFVKANISAETVDTVTLTLKGSDGYFYTDDADTDNEDVKVNGTTAALQVSNGNIYRLDAGYIYKYNNTDGWDKLYKVDGSFDKLSVYDDNNMVAWNQDDEVYSVINGSATTDTKTDTTTTTTTTPAVTAGWVQAANGTWTYNKADGTKATGWLNDGGVWYYLKADGVMATGWVQDGATWYFLKSSGAMATGWLNDNGTWYYLNASGAMLANTTVDGYVLGANGAWVK
jgi:glucan-binding YG repeat protein